MKSDLPKVLHACCDRPMVGWILEAVRVAGVEKTVVVVGHGGQTVQDVLGPNYAYVEQTERLGTAHATSMAASEFEGFEGPVLVLAGDTPLLQGKTLQALLDKQSLTGAQCVMTTCRLDDPTGYGRIVRNAEGKVTGVVEHKDCTPEQLLIDEVNPAIYCFDGPTLFRLLPKVKNDNAQGEYYLPDVIKMVAESGQTVETVESDDPDEFRGVNDRWQLAEATAVLKSRIMRKLCLDGVTIVDPQSCYIGPDVQIGQDSSILPHSIITGRTVIGRGSIIGPNSYVRNSKIGDDATVMMSHVNEAEVGDLSKVGPFANIRPESRLGKAVKVGNFVEVKKSTLADRASVSHLSYIGDAEVGARTNIGAGTITCNYDGFRKYRTTIGKDCFVGSHSTLVAPVTVEDDSMVAAGSVVTFDVPAGALAIGRGKQENKEQWFITWRKRQENR